jgi:hypothetical protein
MLQGSAMAVASLHGTAAMKGNTRQDVQEFTEGISHLHGGMNSLVPCTPNLKGLLDSGMKMRMAPTQPRCLLLIK